jgi:hypothetical protein
MKKLVIIGKTNSYENYFKEKNIFWLGDKGGEREKENF